MTDNLIFDYLWNGSIPSTVAIFMGRMMTMKHWILRHFFFYDKPIWLVFSSDLLIFHSKFWEDDDPQLTSIFLGVVGTSNQSCPFSFQRRRRRARGCLLWSRDGIRNQCWTPDRLCFKCSNLQKCLTQITGPKPFDLGTGDISKHRCRRRIPSVHCAVPANHVCSPVAPSTHIHAMYVCTVCMVWYGMVCMYVCTVR